MGCDENAGITVHDPAHNGCDSSLLDLGPSAQALSCLWEAEAFPPAGWKAYALLPLNIGVPLPHYGVYSLELLVDGQMKKSVPLRVTPATTDLIR
jgi:hypothetical protein